MPIVCSPTGPANDPLVFCRGQATEGLALLTRRYGIEGYATSVHTACASGGQALGTAMKLIRRGYVDRVLAGGFDSMISPIGIGGFCLLSALSTDNDDAAAREPSFRRDAQRLPARRRRGLSSCSRSGRPRARAARASTPSSRATATRCRAIASPTRRPTATGRSRRCARRSPMPGRRPSDIDYINAHGTSTLMNDRSETRGDPRRVRRRLEARGGELDQEHDGTPHRRRRRRRRRGLRARHRSRRDAGECEPASSATPTAISTSSPSAAARPRAHDAVQFLRLRRLEQLHRDAPSGRSRRRTAARTGMNAW